jgi:hypothetical protein
MESMPSVVQSKFWAWFVAPELNPLNIVKMVWTQRRLWLIYLLYKNGYRIFKPVEITIKWDWSIMEENRGDETILLIIHIHIEMSHVFLCYTNKKFISFYKNICFYNCMGAKMWGGHVWGWILYKYCLYMNVNGKMQKRF